MAAVLISGAVKHFTGLSSDVKPSDVPAGSMFLEADTAYPWVFNGVSWTIDARRIRK